MKFSVKLGFVLLLSTCTLFCFFSSCNSKKLAEETKSDLTYAQAEEPNTLDAARVGETSSAIVAYNIYESLLRFREGTSEIIPCLAVKWWESENHLSHFFELRKDVSFHDNTHFDAEAVKFNVERQLGNSQFPYAESVYGMISRVEIIDEYTIEFKLKEICSYFINNMAMDIGTYIASPQAIKQSYDDDISSNPVGTGPYEYVNWKRGQHIKLKRNENYWGEKAKQKNLTFKFIKEPSFRIVALNNGEVDIAEKIDFALIDKVKSSGNVVNITDMIGTYYLSYNTKKEFLNPQVRCTISSAINIPELVGSVCNGQLNPANCMLPPGILGRFNNNLSYSFFDPIGAKKFFEKTKLPKLKILSLSSSEAFGNYLQWAEAIQSYLKKVGVESEIIPYDLKAFKEKTKNGDFDLCVHSWISDNADADNFLNIFSSKNPELNIPKYFNKEIDELFLRGGQTTNKQQREAIYTEIEKTLLKDSVVLPLFYIREVSAYQSKISDYVINPTGTIRFANIKVL
ncbi:MAG: ABC transporter substrate-binding protein [Oscillospiraceae bacterium]|nr:ABC transporter substrate-binding protein [Oscillospiraceae bacterium]